MVTLSDKGLIINNNKGFIHNKIEKKKIIDVSGAGDTEISLATIYFILIYQKSLLQRCVILLEELRV